MSKFQVNCAVCDETSLSSAQCKLPIADIEHLASEMFRTVAPPPLPFNLNAGPLKYIMPVLDPDGVIVDSDG